MNWVLLLPLLYVTLLIGTCIHILLFTQQGNKALAYILFAVFIPGIGIGFYYLFGFNYWTKKRYNRKFLSDSGILKKVKEAITHYDSTGISRLDNLTAEHGELAAMLIRDLGSPLTKNNQVRLLNNGEEKFPELFEAIRGATHHVHIEYYIFEADGTGTALLNLLIEKAKAGVEVRLIYDDFGSPGIKKAIERRIREAGAWIFPFHKVNFYLLANRLNYRNHRKIVIVDGKTAFTGGINISDKYVNNGKNKLYWRDTHVRIDGPAVYYLQYIFITDWQFCSRESITLSGRYFPAIPDTGPGKLVQIAASGPDSVFPSTLYTLLQAIYLAKEEILITTPYFIPGDSVVDALRIAALSGLSVKLLVPGISDSRFVNAAARSYFQKLLEAGVEIYLYQKGFVHAKTMVTDQKVSIIGTANMDFRSFEFNFEVSAVIYNKEVAAGMRQAFMDDLKDAVQVSKAEWLRRAWYRQLPEKFARLFSPVM